MRTYSELCSIEDYFDRYQYLRVKQSVGERTFGGDRWVNQRFYTSKEWKDLRLEIISRDGGFDMGHPDYPINGKIYIHHMNPMDIKMLTERDPTILSPEHLISVSMMTHQAIHFGDQGLLPSKIVARTPGDTILWGKRPE